MNTPIIKISDDQNEITHESGVVTVFVKDGMCRDCCYSKVEPHMKRMCLKIPCSTMFEPNCRKDGIDFGIFKLKQQ